MTEDLEAGYVSAGDNGVVKNQEGIKGTFSKINTIRQKIIEETKGKKPSQGQIVCPECGKRRWYSIASNGHVHSKCVTEDCPMWME